MVERERESETQTRQHYRESVKTGGCTVLGAVPSDSDNMHACQPDFHCHSSPPSSFTTATTTTARTNITTKRREKKGKGGKEREKRKGRGKDMGVEWIGNVGKKNGRRSWTLTPSTITLTNIPLSTNLITPASTITTLSMSTLIKYEKFEVFFFFL